MKTPGVLLEVFGVTCVITLAACGKGIPPPTQIVAVTEQGSFSYQGGQPIEPPEEFRNLTNPMEGSAESAIKGKAIFEADCASCHGQEARGDGLAGASLDPKPTDLASVQDSLSDGYLYWRISEGGAFAPFSSSMPAWRGLLSEDHIWKVITYLRSLKG
jgi:mono/diheme cytochrome c family protein